MERTLSQIFRHLTHELKRPLASLQQSVHVLLDEISGPVTAEQRRILEIQLRNAKRLSNCIAQLGDLSQLEDGLLDLQLANHDLGSLIEEVVSDLQDQSNERQITVRVDLPIARPNVKCDRNLMCRALARVVENAIRFSPTGKTVQIGVRQVSRVPSEASRASLRGISEPEFNPTGYIVVSVADWGPGVIESEREAIFQRFYQVKDNDRAYKQGLGIGLTLCRGIVEAHHGAVWVEANPGGGSLVQLVFPISAGSETQTRRLGTLAKSV